MYPIVGADWSIFCYRMFSYWSSNIYYPRKGSTDRFVRNFSTFLGPGPKQSNFFGPGPIRSGQLGHRTVWFRSVDPISKVFQCQMNLKQITFYLDVLNRMQKIFQNIFRQRQNLLFDQTEF